MASVRARPWLDMARYGDSNGFGTDPEEQQWLSSVDRVNTTATVWLGTTLQCAQCHNHKFDPFTQKDYCRFLAFFNTARYDIRTEGQGEILAA